MSAQEGEVYEEPVDPDTIDDDLAAEAQYQDDAFHRTYERDHTWEELQEDEHGNLRLDRTAEQRARRQRTLAAAAQQGRVRKGMIRYMLLVVDLSAAAAANDLRPSRLTCMIRAAHEFVRNFFDQNPLSQLGLLVLRDGVCVRLTELSASPDAQLRRLDSAAMAAEGSASLANALDMGVALLRNIPPYGYREMLVLFAALSTCDPGNIMDSIKAAKDNKIRVSVVGLAAEVHVCRRMSDMTGGSYAVALNESHLTELMNAHAPPPPMPAGGARGAELVSMGFPQKGPEGAGSAVFVGVDARQLPGSYACPRCKARVAELPCECHVCNLTLIASPHLARSYHHLFPVPLYQETTWDQLTTLYDTETDTNHHTHNTHADTDADMMDTDMDADTHTQQHHHHMSNGAGPSSASQGAMVLGSVAAGVVTNKQRKRGVVKLRGMGDPACGGDGGGDSVRCYACLRDLGPVLQAGRASQAAAPMVLFCPVCRHVFCFECDLYVHESLHNCPGCETLQQQAHA